jgi:hypothetical protein
MVGPSPRMVLALFALFFIVAVLPRIATALGIGSSNTLFFVAWCATLVLMSLLVGQ